MCLSSVCDVAIGQRDWRQRVPASLVSTYPTPQSISSLHLSTKQASRSRAYANVKCRAKHRTREGQSVGPSVAVGARQHVLYTQMMYACTMQAGRQAKTRGVIGGPPATATVLWLRCLSQDLRAAMRDAQMRNNAAVSDSKRSTNHCVSLSAAMSSAILLYTQRICLIGPGKPPVSNLWSLESRLDRVQQGPMQPLVTHDKKDTAWQRRDGDGCHLTRSPRRLVVCFGRAQRPTPSHPSSRDPQTQHPTTAAAAADQRIKPGGERKQIPAPQIA